MNAKNPLYSARQLGLFAIIFILGLITIKGYAQSDTLHLNYKGLDTKMPDSTEARIVEWAKKLNGKHVDVDVVAYYDQSDFKKFAAERADESFLILNRKARELITINSYAPKKGQKSQRSRVDVIYKVTLTPEEKAAAEKAAKEKKEQEKVATNIEKKEKKEDEKVVKTKDESSKKKEEKKEPVKVVNKPFVAKDEFKARKLIVVLLGENKDEVERLTKKGKNDELEIYRNNVKAYNENITNAFKNFWTETNFEIMSETDVAGTDISEKALDWVLLLPDKKQIEKVDFMTYKATMVYPTGKKKAINEREFKISIPNGIPEEADFLLLMHKIKVYYGFDKEFDRTQLEETLAAKTLYVDTTLTELSPEEFKEEYPHPFKYTGAKEILELANKRDKSVLYFKPDVTGGIINVMIINAETGAIISRTNLSGLAKVSMKTPEGRFGNGSNLMFGGPQLFLEVCTSCVFGNIELFRLYTAKPRVKKLMLKFMINESKQIKHFSPLMIF